jgi:hypothetical protein
LVAGTPAAPPAGYYYPELIAHSVVVTNFREIFNDHIGHILAFVLAFARGLHIFIPQQFRREWKKSQTESGDVVHLPEATALTISTTTMAIPSPTSGPRLPPKSSVKSHVRNKCWNHNTRVAMWPEYLPLP